MSSQGLSMACSVLTDDETTGSNPPPTISDEMSTQESLSCFSALSNKSGGNKNNRRGPSTGNSQFAQLTTPVDDLVAK
eukprot:CAMPEP_0172323858 /NCGR_PEP_ID=MMETSP1058-20130122/49778_1 /TAXON_ID=83371 /ORGANISM="Detonula confervacea, Strain CCMP 353" /LENGTH=77 /DNA_ID=CAMNT_0013039967 /DNA_START=27 /DNA_END=257 /DNA_ORIENTATION=+